MTAHRMARAMDLMREFYDLNMPKGGVPIKYDLRKSSKATQNRATAAGEDREELVNTHS
jgi:hypothetical protein